MKKILLNNNINLICKTTKNTPRVALTCYVNINETEKIPGLYSVLNKLFVQGTKKRSAEQIAYEMEINALDIYSEMKSDYWKFCLVCLKEDFEIAAELLSDIMLNSTFENLDKEIIKLKGETIASLDSPTVLARDKFVENIYKNHQYGHTGSVIIETVDKINFNDVIEAYESIFKPANKVFSVVGDIESTEVKNILEKYFSSLTTETQESKINSAKLEQKNVIKIIKEDANQAQIYQGWLVPGTKSEDSPALSVLNTILGSSGLSSRLFLELRDKKGLAYTVRSVYSKARHNSDFRVYIATEPKNISVALEGFKTEIEKLKNEYVSEKELIDAKNNIIGKIQFITETNLQQAGSIGSYEIEGLGCDYLEKWIERIQKVTEEDIMRVTKKYFNENYILTILAPEKYLGDV